MNGERTISLTLLGIVILFAVVIFYARHITISRQNQVSETPVIAHYTNYAYRVNLRYPPEWQPVGGYSYDRYEGVDGFFGISAGGTEDMSLDEITISESSHQLKPYGSKPYVQRLTIDGQDARLIMPGDDQATAMKGQAALIVEYPEPATVGSETYKFFIFWADRAHIQDIASSITFVRQ
jgi:TolB protein